MNKSHQLSRLAKGIAVLCALLSCIGIFTGCNGTEPTEPTPGLTDAPVETFVLGEDGVCLYRVVRSDYAQSDVTKQAIRVRSALLAVLGEGSKVGIVTDWEDKDGNADIKEILVGETNRPETEAVMAECGKNEYVIRAVGNKIVIVGGTNEALAAAVDAFLVNCVGYTSAENYTVQATLSLPKELNMKVKMDTSVCAALYVTNDSVTYEDALYNALCTGFAKVNRYASTEKPENVFNVKTNQLVVAAGISTVSANYQKAMEDYLNAGGKVLLLGGPAFETILYEQNGKMVTADEFLFNAVAALDESDKVCILDTTKQSAVDAMSRSSDTIDRKTIRTVGDFDLEGSEAQMHIEVPQFSGWDYYLITKLPKVEKGSNCLCFYAKGDEHTSSLFIELKDKTGSRWKATVQLEEDWKYFVLQDADFAWWHDSAAAASDKPDMSDLSYIGFGFAQSGAAMSVGYHSFYMSEPTICNYRGGDLPTVSSLVLDGVSPLYEVFPVTNAASLVTAENQVFVQNRAYRVASNLISCSPGRQGTGYDKGRTTRFVPLIEVLDEKGLHAGYAAWLNFYNSTTDKNGKLEGSAVGCFSAVSNDFYDANGIAAVAEAAKALTQPVLLVEGGTDEYIYVKEDTKAIDLGASLVRRNTADEASFEVTVTLYDGDKVLTVLKGDSTQTLKGLGHNISTLKESYDVSKGYPNRAVTTLTVDGVLVDRIEHTLSFWEAKPESERRYITSEDGYFKRDGEIIRFFGVNYMPTSGVAEPDGSLFEYYVSSAAYDPDVIDADLLRIKDLGMNAVSVFVYYNTVKESNNILDLIDRCEKLGIYVDLSIRPAAYPLSSSYDESQVETLLRKLHFYENDTIIAYDIAWEPRIGGYEDKHYVGRKHWDSDWESWIIVQYGSVEAAEKLWGTKAPRDASGKVIAVTDEMLNSKTAAYNKIVAAYYRFLDDQIAMEMNEKMLSMRKADPNHLFSFRMSMSGSAMETGGYKPSTLCFDFQSLATTLDIFEPEGYALGATDDASLQIVFANAYARYVNSDLPVVWKEYGKQVWSGTNFTGDNDLKEASADYYRYTLERAYASYSDGMFCWYFAGGYRIGEDSDYGILNPDGSDRASTALLREYAEKFLSLGERPAADVVFTAERDDSARGIFAMFDKVKTQMQKAYDGGKTVAIVNGRQTEENGVVYADTVLNEAVGNTATTGKYPLKYVNGMIKSVEVVEKEGEKTVRIAFRNNLQTTWRAGTVSIVSVSGSGVQINATVDTEIGSMEEGVVEIPYTGSGKVKLRFSIEGIEFGNLFTGTIR